MGRAYVQSSALLDHPWSPKMSGASGEEPAGQYTQCAAGATTGPMEVEGVKAAAEAAPVAAFAEATFSPAADSGAAARRGGAEQSSAQQASSSRPLLATRVFAIAAGSAWTPGVDAGGPRVRRAASTGRRRRVLCGTAHMAHAFRMCVSREQCRA